MEKLQLMHLNKTFFIGLPELGDILLHKFKWGSSFIKLNKDLLDRYSECKDAADVVKVQQEYLEEMDKEDRESRKRGEFT